MTGPEHYKCAEKLLAHIEKDRSNELNLQFLAQAQVHATLALAAATAERSGEFSIDWYRVAGR